MSEVFSSSITPARGGEGAGSSRSTSPGEEAEDMPRGTEILEHSLESLVISDSTSEEGILMGAISQELHGIEQLEFDPEDGSVTLDTEAFIAVDEGEVANGEQSSDKEPAKKKKRRISSRRTRAVKLSDCDRVICEIAGVLVGMLQLHAWHGTAKWSVAHV